MLLTFQDKKGRKEAGLTTVSPPKGIISDWRLNLGTRDTLNLNMYALGSN